MVVKIYKIEMFEKDYFEVKFFIFKDKNGKFIVKCFWYIYFYF